MQIHFHKTEKFKIDRVERYKEGMGGWMTLSVQGETSATLSFHTNSGPVLDFFFDLERVLASPMRDEREEEQS